MKAEQKRERIVRFRVNDDEYNAIAKAAEEAEFDSMSDYIRTISIDRCIFTIDKDELAKLRRAILAISNNINQIAIRVNSTRTIYPDGKVPSVEALTKRRTALIEQRNAKNDEYKTLTAELKELEYARQTVADYLKNERDVQKQKKSRNDLE